MGRLEVVTGCMFSGKTEELLRRIERAEIAGQTTQVVKPSIDDRHSQEDVKSRNGRQRTAKILDPEKDLLDQYDGSNAEVIAIDEANFFNNSLIDYVTKLSEDKRVIAAGLDQTYRAEPFNPVHKLMAISDDVEKFKAICVKCGSEATRTQRFVNGEPSHAEEPTIIVGGEQKYEARCRDCHIVRTD